MSCGLMDGDNKIGRGMQKKKVKRAIAKCAFFF